MKIKILFLFLTGILLGCNSENMDVSMETNAPTQVLMLKVDYTTNAFEGGTIFGFPQKTDKFTIENKYVEPGDFGSVKLTQSDSFRGNHSLDGFGENDVTGKIEAGKFF